MPLEERELRELLMLSQRADLQLVVMHAETFEAADPATLVHGHELALGVRNVGRAAELYYRVTFEISCKGERITKSVYDPMATTTRSTDRSRSGGSMCSWAALGTPPSPAPWC